MQKSKWEQLKTCEKVTLTWNKSDFDRLYHTLYINERELWDKLPMRDPHKR